MVEPDGPAELVTDKGYHSRGVVRRVAEAGIRTYISEPERGRQRWDGQAPEQAAVYGNRRRLQGERGQRLQRQRGEKLERVMAHLYETGRMRRVHLRGHNNILKRLLIHACGLNLGLLMRSVGGVGTHRGLQGRDWAALLIAWRMPIDQLCTGVRECMPRLVTNRLAETPIHQPVSCSHGPWRG